MLRYSLKLDTEMQQTVSMEWSERYLAPDLSMVSGVTSPTYHIDTMEQINVVNTATDYSASLMVEANNAKRTGYVVVKKQQYPIITGVVHDYTEDNVDIPIEYYAILIKGKYYYAQHESSSLTFTIDDFLQVSPNASNNILISNIISGTMSVTCDDDSQSIGIDTVYWIEDNKVNIGGNEYYYDREEQPSNDLGYGTNSKGIFQYYEDGDVVPCSALTQCQEIDIYPITDMRNYQTVTKFQLYPNANIPITYESIGYGAYAFYIMYQDEYCPITMDKDGNCYCQIPSYLTVGYSGDENEDLQYQQYNVYAVIGDIPDNIYEIITNPTSGSIADSYEIVELTAQNTKEHQIYDLDGLYGIMAYVQIDGGTYFVQNDIISANNGRYLLIDVNEDSHLIEIGDKLTLIGNSTPYQSIVFTDEKAGKEFIVFGGRQYWVQPHLCDKALINGQEYPITYINGLQENVDCLVEINDESVPMKLMVSGDTWMVQKYGIIVQENEGVMSAQTAVYPIINYDGVKINDTNYHIETVSSDTSYRVAILETANEISIEVQDIMGSSLFMCSPYLPDTDHSNQFIYEESVRLCQEVMQASQGWGLEAPNRIFGKEPITPELPFKVVSNPTSTDDFMDYTDKLEIDSPNGFFSLTMPFIHNNAGNPLQDDLISTDFYEAEVAKVINPIVDMEKDVYTPKYIPSGDYIGSSTVFKPIYEIDVNLHFRTRNMDSWKVNDSNADSSVENMDNWFITDYFPYNKISGRNKDELMGVSDLIGLLNFSNDDVYYQKLKIANSFLRFSYYDSTDPQTQSLMATSCVFMNEHTLYKTFIDNSRKNVNDYGQIEEGHYLDESGNTLPTNSGAVLNKISVLSEYIGKKTQKTTYTSIPIDNLLMNDRRIDCGFKIKGKYATDTSSEGFYIYMFREYSENLHPKPIYMKVEFNHAGVGKIIPFLIPMKWTNDTDETTSVYPTEPLTLSNDEETLCSGIPLSYVYAQTYIPLYAVYDFQNKEYGYVFDNRYITVDENGVAQLNLFEMKIMDESESDVVHKTAVIDINKQFQSSNYTL